MANQFKTGSSQLQQMISTALIAALLFPNALAQSPQTQPPAQQPKTDKDKQGLYRLRVESELVLVNVVARDKQGKPVTDLKQDDFTVLEDGKPQRVSSFDFENLDMQPIMAATGPSQEARNGPSGAGQADPDGERCRPRAEQQTRDRSLFRSWLNGAG